MDPFQPQFNRNLKSDKKLGGYLRSNLYSNYLPGLTDLNTSFSSMMSQPFTRQAGGGVGDIDERNQMEMQSYNPARSSLVTENEQQKNLFADALSATGSSRANIMNMINMLKLLQMQMGTSSTGGLAGGLGGLGSGLGL